MAERSRRRRRRSGAPRTAGSRASVGRDRDPPSDAHEPERGGHVVDRRDDRRLEAGGDAERHDEAARAHSAGLMIHGSSRRSASVHRSRAGESVSGRHAQPQGIVAEDPLAQARARPARARSRSATGSPCPAARGARARAPFSSRDRGERISRPRVAPSSLAERGAHDRAGPRGTARRRAAAR